MSDHRPLPAVPLTDVWARDGLVSVVVSSLEDAGFHPILDCDPRGPMHYYGWPLGSQRPVTVWIPRNEYAEAADFLQAASELPCEDDGSEAGPFVTVMSRRRRLVYGGWLAGELLGVAAIAGAVALAPTLGLRRRPSDKL